MNDNDKTIMLPPGWRPMSEPPKLRRRTFPANKYVPVPEDYVMDEMPVLIAYHCEPGQFEDPDVEFVCWPARYMWLKSKRKPIWVSIDDDDREATPLGTAIGWHPMPSPFQVSS